MSCWLRITFSVDICLYKTIRAKVSIFGDFLVIWGKSYFFLLLDGQTQAIDMLYEFRCSRNIIVVLFKHALCPAILSYVSLVPTRDFYLFVADNPFLMVLETFLRV